MTLVPLITMFIFTYKVAIYLYEFILEQRASQHTQNTSCPCSRHFSTLPQSKLLNSCIELFQFISNQRKMGNTCCQDQVIDANKIIPQFSAPLNHEYYQCELIKDNFLIDRFKEAEEITDFANILEKQKMMKHKFLDRYYIGEWSIQGFPLGRGILYQPQNYFYRGEINKYAQGHGKVHLLKQQIVYEGEFKEGKAEGKGRLFSVDGKYQFQGIMRNSVPITGVFKIHHSDPSKECTINLQNFPQKPAQLLFSDNRIYTGSLNKRTYLPQGEGIAYHSDHSHYQGYFEEGLMHGSGTYYWPDGSSYKGEYQYGKKHGHGVFFFKSGRSYSGQWLNGKQNGKGELYEKTGKLLKKGIWKDGILQKQQ